MGSKRALGVAAAALLTVATALAAQPQRQACADAARALVQQPTSFEQSRGYGDTVRWRASNGARGVCRVDRQGRVYQVEVESWGGGWGGGPDGHGDDRGISEEQGYDRRGGDYNSIQLGSVEACQDTCQHEERCMAYTYNTSEGRCYLKSSASEPQVAPGRISGAKYSGAFAGDNLTVERGADHRGGDYNSFRTSGLEICMDACRHEDRCRAYTFDTTNGTCYLKDRVYPAQPNGITITGFKRN